MAVVEKEFLNMQRKSKRVLDTVETSHYIGVSIAQLKKGRAMGQIEGRVETPPYIKLGARRVGYLIEDLDAWLEARRVG